MLEGFMRVEMLAEISLRVGTAHPADATHLGLHDPGLNQRGCCVGQWFDGRREIWTPVPRTPAVAALLRVKAPSDATWFHCALPHLPILGDRDVRELWVEK